MESERLQQQIDRLLDDAEQANSQLDWITLQKRAQDVVAIDPNNQEGQAFPSAAEWALSASGPQATNQSETATPATSEIPDQPTTFSHAPPTGESHLKKEITYGYD